MRNKTACFTGHRLIAQEQYEAVKRRIRETVTSLIEAGYRFFESGGAKGFDMLAAQVVIELKEQYPSIQLILVLPYGIQNRSWNECEKTVCEKVKAQADEVIYISSQYTRGCFHKRNRYLVDTSSTCICYLNMSIGGTAYTVDYAKRRSVQIINIIA